LKLLLARSAAPFLSCSAQIGALGDGMFYIESEGANGKARHPQSFRSRVFSSASGNKKPATDLNRRPYGATTSDGSASSPPTAPG